MKIAVISDIHGHLSNLAECLGNIRERSVSNIVCLGDVLNEDRETNRLMMLTFRKYKIRGVLGNHDLAWLADAGIIPWKDMAVSEETYSFFSRFPIRAKYRNLMFTHICPSYSRERTGGGEKPDISDSLNCVKHSGYHICFVGHVHKPLIADDSGLNISPLPDHVAEISNKRKYIINPGALGVPKKPTRYGIIDMEKQNFISVVLNK